MIAVFAGGPNINFEAVAPLIKDCSYVLAADSGACNCLKAGIIPSKVIGDLDSISDSDLLTLRDKRVPFEMFPPEKDMSDTELCLRSISKTEDILLVCSLCGRPDHVMCNLMLLIKLREEGFRISATDGINYYFPMSGEDRLAVEGITYKDSCYVSFMPIEETLGVSTNGLYYALDGDTIYPGSSLTLSNKLIQGGNSFEVSIKSGKMGVFVVKDE